MTDHLERRVEKLEETQANLSTSLNTLNTTLALLNQSVNNIAENEEKKRVMLERGLLYVVGGFLAAFVAWIARGGLSS